jgi:D-lactate dehydrogenase
MEAPLKIAFFDTHSFEKEAFEKVNSNLGHEIVFLEPKLNASTALLAKGIKAVCAFVNDKLDAETLTLLKEGGTEIIALRSAGFNHVDLSAVTRLGLRVVRVPEYSPYAIAEHVVALIQTLNRKTHRSFNRVREGNFSLNGLVGFDLHGKTVGVMGVGKIGKVLAKIMTGFGCKVLLYDKAPDEKFAHHLNCRYVTKEEVFKESDIISLHLPLTPETKYTLNETTLGLTKKGVMIINTGRGGLIDTKALIRGLKSCHIGSAGLDVYEEEDRVFFQDLSDQILTDDILARLLTFSNVVITSHQGFLTHEALGNIADTTLMNLSRYEKSEALLHEVKE